MKPWFAALLTASLVVPFPLGAEDAIAPGPKDAETLAHELADESYRVRERATMDLWLLGDKALPALEQAVKSPDPERAIRARELLRKIQLHITPDTDPAVIDWVESYADASPTEKASLLTKMRGKRAWRQMLKLYAAETNAELREKLQPTMRSVAQSAARERLLKGDVAAAREFLELAPADSSGLLALAEFHRTQGTLEQELQRAMTLQGRKGAVWRLALLRAAGDAAAARRAATEADEPRIAAAMAMMAGDPLPWLNSIGQNPESSTVPRLYARIAAKRWQGGMVRTSDLAQLGRLAQSRDDSESGAAVSALFLLTELKRAEPALIKLQPLAAFQHFDALERIPDALRAIGIDPQQPDYPEWVKSRLASLLDEDVAEQHDVSDSGAELIAVACFLERRGLHQAAREAFSAPLMKLADEDLNAFSSMLGQLFTRLGGAPRLARNIAVAWAGGDEERWQEVSIAAFGDNEHAAGWWDWLAQARPDASRTERFDALLALFGIVPDPGGIREQWLDLLWKSATDAAGNERENRFQRLAELFSETGDVERSLKTLEALPAEARDKIFWGQTLIHYSAVERWNDAAELILQQIRTLQEAGHDAGPDLHAYAAAALRAAGRDNDAAEHDRWAEQLSLGQSSTALRIGNGYAYGNDYHRAAEWWARAVMLADPDGDDFSTALKFHNDALLADEAWPLVASTSEVLAASYAGIEYLMSSQLQIMRLRLQADFARALTRIDKDRAAALAMLENCHRAFASDGSLADFFFPGLRNAGLVSEHDRWFRASWGHFQEVIEQFPESENTLNTAAWFATRALRELDAAENHLRRALEMNPLQAAYLDTMAELYFARGQRAKALTWSQKAVNVSPADTMIRRQHERFRNEPFPR